MRVLPYQHPLRFDSPITMEKIAFSQKAWDGSALPKTTLLWWAEYAATTVSFHAALLKHALSAWSNVLKTTGATSDWK